MKSKNKKKLFVLALLIINISNSFADKEFDIDPIGQDKSYWCWAACCEMISDAYKMDIYGDYGGFNQYDVANWAVNGNNERNALGGSDYSVDQVLWHYGEIACNYTDNPDGSGQGNISKEDLSYEIDQGRPIIAAIVIDDGELYLHDVLIRGYIGSGGENVNYVIYNDPDNGGTREQDSYAQFVRTGNSWAWYETLRLITNPREKISSGVGSSHKVQLWDTDCTLEITQSPQSLSYMAVKNGDTPVSWEWKLVFPHTGGDAVVESWSTNTPQGNLIWDIPDFVLPSNYDWVYQFDGKLVGRIEVICMDPDYHDDAINVIYVPDDLYPGILIYDNQVVNDNQPDVRSHQILIAENDNFMPGGNISLKSGGRIYIKDGITIGNGSQVDFVIDPSLR